MSVLAAVSAGRSGFLVLIKTRVFEEGISGVRVRTEGRTSDEIDPLRIVGSGSGVVGLSMASGTAVAKDSITTLLMPSSRR